MLTLVETSGPRDSGGGANCGWGAAICSTGICTTCVIGAGAGAGAGAGVGGGVGLASSGGGGRRRGIGLLVCGATCRMTGGCAWTAGAGCTTLAR